MSDEVSGGPDAPGRGRAALVILVVVVVAALAVTALRRGVDSPGSRDTALPTRSPAASVPPVPSLALDQVCRPVRVTGPNALDVSFSLRNNSDVPATLVSVEPRLPLAGLLERGYTIRSGRCPATGGTLTDSRLERSDPVQVPPIGSVVATLHFALPDECPKPYPVQVVVTELPERAAPTINTPYTLLADLGEVSFPNC